MARRRIEQNARRAAMLQFSVPFWFLLACLLITVTAMLLLPVWGLIVLLVVLLGLIGVGTLVELEVRARSIQRELDQDRFGR